jgi:hypothetical protein
LLEVNANKKVYLVLDNARTHNNSNIQNLWNINKKRLVLINTQAYLPEFNPQENIGYLLKDNTFNIEARLNINALLKTALFSMNNLMKIKIL